MKAVVDDSCVACGVCPEICPEVFKLDGPIAEVIADPIPPSAVTAAREAAQRCPVESIHLSE